MSYQLLIYDCQTEGQGAGGVTRLTLDELACDVPCCGIRLDAVAGDEMSVRVTVCSGGCAVKCGDDELNVGESRVVPVTAAICGEGWRLRLRRLHRRARVSFNAVLVGRIATLAVAVTLLAQLFFAYALPMICRNSTLWRRQREVQRIFVESDKLQKQLEGFKCDDAVTSALVAALREEMNDRRDFLRDRAMDMSPSLRRAMLENMERTSRLLERIDKRGDVGIMPPLPSLDVDTPIRNVIEDNGE